MKRIITFLHGLGDNIMAFPAIKKLKERYPDDEIYIFGFKYLSAKNIWKNNPYISGYHELGVDFHPTYWFKPKLNQEKIIIKPIINEKIKEITKGEPYVHKFIEIQDKSTHELKAIASELGIRFNSLPKKFFFSSEEEKKTADEFFNKHQIFKHNKFIVIHQSAGVEHKRWNPGKTKEFIKTMLDNYDMPTIIIDPTPNTRKNLPEPTVIIDDFETFTPGVVYEIIKKASAFIGTDSFPLHLADCTETPIVALFITTSLIRTRPVSQNSVFVCSSEVYYRTEHNFVYNNSHKILLGNEIIDALTSIEPKPIINALKMLKVIK